VENERKIKAANVVLEKDGFCYLGTIKPVYFLRAAELGEIYKNLAKCHPDLTLEGFIELLDSLTKCSTRRTIIRSSASCHQLQPG